MKAFIEVPLVFSYSFAELIELSITKEAFLRRDQKELLQRGVTIERLDEFVANRQLLLNAPIYKIEKKEHTLALRACEEKRMILADAMIEIKGIAANTFSKKGVRYLVFNLKGINKLPDETLIETVPTFVKYGKANMDTMGKSGLTLDMLTNITAVAAELSSLLNVPTELMSDSNTATISRHVSQNNFFIEMRNMCDTGHLFFRKLNKVKAKDYVMDKRKPKFTKRVGKVKGNATTSRKAAEVDDKTKIKLKVTVGTSLQFYFGMNKKSPPTEKALTVVNNKKDFVTATAASLGYDKEGGIIHFIIYNPNEDEGTFVVKIG